MRTPGLEGYGRSLLSTCSLCLLLQIFVILLHTRKGAKRIMARELLYVLKTLKPEVDAHREATGQEASKHAIVVPEKDLSKLGWGEELVPVL